MALCSSGPNPPVVGSGITNGLKLYIDSPWGADGGFPGDYSVAGVGTRKNGTGVIKLKDIPPNTDILHAFLIYNTYQANVPVAHPTVTLNGTDASGDLYGICNSTCWYNPPFEATTYLRNRVYIRNVGPSGGGLDLVKGNGNYTVAGLINSPAMRIGTDGDRIPGCRSSQGAILFVIWEYNEDAPSEKFKTDDYRAVNMYLGARLLSNNVTFGAGENSFYNLAFSPVQDTTDNNYFKGNSHIEVAAGDTQNSIPGDSFAINQVRFVTPNNAFTKIGSSLCVRKFSVAQIYDGENSAFARTTNDCIDWFFFAISGDKTQPKSQFQIVNCCATYLVLKANPEDTTIQVYSNFVQAQQTASPMDCLSCGKCRAVKYNPISPDFVGPPAPNPPGMFPAAPYYIKIDDEIMKVTAKGVTEGPGPPEVGIYADPTTWTVERAQAGTAAALHKPSLGINISNLTQITCVYMLAPPRFIRDMQAGLTPRGPRRQQPDAGRPAGQQGDR
jgi:hypothetical protein